ncbi:thiol reductant ABC exporter subunit CydD, partial [Rhabdaerophilum calidifontis]|uniref:thiol reductant ABC exporter subunit CydD n=1 Tax=Rhabdaerophilum calidifontis TaxID=2604328 RepID=UPI001239DC60
RPVDPGRGVLQCAASNPDGGLTEAGIHLGNAPKLFKQTEPALFSRYLPARFQAAILPLGMFIVIAPLDWISGLALLVTAPMIPFFMVLIGKGAETLNQRQWLRLQRMSGHFLDAMQGLATIKAFNAGRRMTHHVADAAESYRQETMRVLRIAFLSALTLEFFSTVSIAMIAVLIGFRLLWGEMTYLHGLFILLLAPEFYLPLRTMGAAYHARMEALGAAERLLAIEALPELARTGWRTAQAGALKQAPAIAMLDLHLTYPGDRPALRGVSIAIAAGETVALTGASGSGKSSLIALLMGFAIPQAGEIRIDDVPLESFSLEAWRRSIAYVPQRPTLFSGSVAANIALGDPEPDPARIREAARRARIEERILALPSGYETLIGAGGHALSGGEAQRIGLARAFYREAFLVLLDEPTGHLDPETENAIHTAISALKPGRTMILIAHRESTRQLADRVITLAAGRVAEQDPAPEPPVGPVPA